MLHVAGLTHYEEAYQYMHRLYADPVMATKLSGMHALIISDENLELLLKYYSIDEYILFYEENFVAPTMEEHRGDELDAIIFE